MSDYPRPSTPGRSFAKPTRQVTPRNEDPQYAPGNNASDACGFSHRSRDRSPPQVPQADLPRPLAGPPNPSGFGRGGDRRATAAVDIYGKLPVREETGLGPGHNDGYAAHPPPSGCPSNGYGPSQGNGYGPPTDQAYRPARGKGFDHSQANSTVPPPANGSVPHQNGYPQHYGQQSTHTIYAPSHPNGLHHQLPSSYNGHRHQQPPAASSREPYRNGHPPGHTQHHHRQPPPAPRPENAYVPGSTPRGQYQFPLVHPSQNGVHPPPALPAQGGTVPPPASSIGTVPPPASSSGNVPPSVRANGTVPPPPSESGASNVPIPRRGKRAPSGPAPNEPPPVRRDPQRKAMSLVDGPAAVYEDIGTYWTHVKACYEAAEVAEFVASVGWLLDGKASKQKEIERGEKLLKEHLLALTKNCQRGDPVYATQKKLDFSSVWNKRFSRSNPMSLRYRRAQREATRADTEAKEKRDAKRKGRGIPGTPAKVANVGTPAHVTRIHTANRMQDAAGFSRKARQDVPHPGYGPPEPQKLRSYGRPGGASTAPAPFPPAQSPAPHRPESWTRPDDAFGELELGHTNVERGGLGMFRYYASRDPSRLSATEKTLDALQTKVLTLHHKCGGKFVNNSLNIRLSRQTYQGLEFMDSCYHKKVGGILTNAGSESARNAIFMWITAFVEDALAYPSSQVPGSEVLLVIPEADLLKWQFSSRAYTPSFLRTIVLSDMVGGVWKKAADMMEEWAENRGLLMITTEALERLFELRRDNALSFIFRKAIEDPGPGVAIIVGAHMLRDVSYRLRKELRKMRTPVRFAATAAPLAGNNIFQFHAMADWALPDVCSDVDTFRAQFVEPALCKLSIRSLKPPVKRDVEEFCRRTAALLVNKIKMTSCSIDQPPFIDVREHLVVKLNMEKGQAEFYCDVMSVLSREVCDRRMDPVVAATFAQVAASDVDAFRELALSLRSLHLAWESAGMGKVHPAVGSLLATVGIVDEFSNIVRKAKHPPHISNTHSMPRNRLSCKFEALVIIYSDCIKASKSLVVFCATLETRNSMHAAMKEWALDPNQQEVNVGNIFKWGVDVPPIEAPQRLVERGYITKLRAGEIFFATVTGDSHHWEAAGNVLEGDGNTVIVMADCPWSIVANSQVHSRLVCVATEQKPVVISLVTRRTVEDDWNDIHSEFQRELGSEVQRPRTPVLFDPEIDDGILTSPPGGARRIEASRKSEYPNVSEPLKNAFIVLLKLMEEGQLVNDVQTRHVVVPGNGQMPEGVASSHFAFVRSQFERSLLKAFQGAGSIPGKARFDIAVNELRQRGDVVGKSFDAWEDDMDLTFFLIPQLRDPSDLKFQTLFNSMRAHFDLYSFRKGDRGAFVGSNPSFEVFQDGVNHLGRDKSGGRNMFGNGGEAHRRAESSRTPPPPPPPVSERRGSNSLRRVDPANFGSPGWRNAGRPDSGGGRQQRPATPGGGMRPDSGGGRQQRPATPGGGIRPDSGGGRHQRPATPGGGMQRHETPGGEMQRHVVPGRYLSGNPRGGGRSPGTLRGEKQYPGTPRGGRQSPGTPRGGARRHVTPR